MTHESSKIFSGFKLGMLLQLAVGPICIFIFQMAAAQGFHIAMTGVFGIILIDGLYIFAAILGIAPIIDKENVRWSLKIFSAAILFVFGLSIILNQFNIHLLPALHIKNSSHFNNVFLHASLLTLANPLTILFWAGIFSAKIAENIMKKKDIYAFGFGALLSTLFFLTLIALLGSFTQAFFTKYALQILNLIVGFLLIYFSIRTISRKT